MIKNIAKRTIVTIGLFSAVLSVNPLTTLTCTAVNPIVHAAEVPPDETKADQIGWVFRRHNGWLQKRRWNYTKGYWVDKYWINVAPLQ
ncbi:MAG: hypothetical protein IJI25_09320 [Eubacterium sp.]|nr:hypothetical protein [Eubacterium sp.]